VGKYVTGRNGTMAIVPLFEKWDGMFCNGYVTVSNG